MLLTPVRILTCVLAMPFALVVGTAACGQVTGLSNDYVYDLKEDGGSTAADALGESTALGDGAQRQRVVLALGPAQVRARVRQRHPGAGDRRGAGAAVGL
ncbi:MAG: hypothetical protein NVS3B10_09250 [Polyangiales bacterium]